MVTMCAPSSKIIVIVTIWLCFLIIFTGCRAFSKMKDKEDKQIGGVIKNMKLNGTSAVAENPVTSEVQQCTYPPHRGSRWRNSCIVSVEMKANEKYNCTSSSANSTIHKWQSKNKFNCECSLNTTTTTQSGDYILHHTCRINISTIISTVAGSMYTLKPYSRDIFLQSLRHHN